VIALDTTTPLGEVHSEAAESFELLVDVVAAKEVKGYAVFDERLLERLCSGCPSGSSSSSVPSPAE
jgi:hypothetical protein